MNTTFCVKCKSAIPPTDIFCRFCGVDQRLPSLQPSASHVAVASAIPLVAQPGVQRVPATSITRKNLIAMMWTAFALACVCRFAFGYRYIMAEGKPLSGAWGVVNGVGGAAWLVSLVLSIMLLTGRAEVERRNGGIVLALHLIGFVLYVFLLLRMLSHMSLVG